MVEQVEEFKVPKKAVKRKMVEQTEKEDSNMDTESIESGVLSGVEGTLPKARPAFPPIKREKLADGSEVRKIPVPSHRYTPLKEKLADGSEVRKIPVPSHRYTPLKEKLADGSEVRKI